MVDRTGAVSKRGAAYADPANKAPMLDVVCDLWHPESNPGGYLSLGVAENTLMHPELIEFMAKSFSIDSHSLTYGDGFSGTHRLRDVIAQFINDHFSPVTPVVRSHVAVTSGVGPGIEQCAFSLCDPGHGVLLGRPYYGNFPSDLESRAGAKVIGVCFGDIDPFSIDAVAVYEKALQDAKRTGLHTRALLLCNPHNPLGRCYTREVLLEYMRLCQKYNLHLISDEIYALSVWDNPRAPDAPKFTSVLSIDASGIIDPSLVHVLWGMSKDFGSNGIRLGCIVSQHNKSFLQALEGNSYLTCPSALSDRVTVRILSDSHFVQRLLRLNLSRLAATYEVTVQFLDTHGIPFCGGVNAGFFVWVDLFAPLRKQMGHLWPEKDPWAVEENLHTTLLKHKVFLASGKAFGGDVPGWFRIVFAHPERYLREGLERIIQGLSAYRRQLGQGGYVQDGDTKAPGRGVLGESAKL